MRKTFVTFLVVLISLSCSAVVFGVKERTNKSTIEEKEFISDCLSVNNVSVNISELINKLPDSDIWLSFLAKHKNSYVYIDQRSVRPASIVLSIPLIPGTSINNNITMEALSQSLGYRVTQLTEGVIRDVAKQFIRRNTVLFNIKLDEIGEIRIGNPTDYLWQVLVKRQKSGIPVRDSNLGLTISRGSLVLMGIVRWGDITISLDPSITSEKAIDIAFNYIGGKQKNDEFKVRPHLEIMPVSSLSWDNSLGKGYEHRLTWAFIFNRPGYINTWEFLIDAHNGEILAFHDLNQYAAKKRKIVGAIYPLTDDGCCPEGCAVEQTPMPFVDTGFAYPNDYTNLGGIYRYIHGWATTTLTGMYAHICDLCSPQPDCSEILESSITGNIDLGGANGEHDCTTQSSLGNTFAARTAFDEITSLNRIARGWSKNSWLDHTFVTAQTNSTNPPCNAGYHPVSNMIELRRSGDDGHGSVCRNTGEILSIIDHEWAHALDLNGTNPNVSWPESAFADAVAIYRTHDSCEGRGMLMSCDGTPGCHPICSCDPLLRDLWKNCPSNPGVGYGWNCHGYGDRCIDCTGVRDSDYEKHMSGIPHTIANYNCPNCLAGNDQHCSALPVTEAAWDFVMRNLQTSPFKYDKQTSFEIGSRLLYIGIDAIEAWFSAPCPDPNPYGGCGAQSAYMQWLIADDDDSDLSNGTPHMTAIYDAFNLHGIACATPPPQNSGCAFSPLKITGLEAIPGPGDYSITLNWDLDLNSSWYYIYRTEGWSELEKGCDFGKIIIGSVPNLTTTYTDYQVLNGRTYYYSVQGVKENIACYGPLSDCVSAVPTP